MSKIIKDGLTQSATGCFMAVPRYCSFKRKLKTHRLFHVLMTDYLFLQTFVMHFLFQCWVGIA